MDPEDEEVAAEFARERRRRDRTVGLGQWNLFTLDDKDHVLANLAPVVTTGTSACLALWGVLTLASGASPGAEYGALAVLGAAGLYRATAAFTSGARWALPVVAAAPLATAAGLYVLLSPAIPFRGPGDALAWSLVAVIGLSPLTLPVGPVHPSWVDEPGRAQ